MIHPNFIEFFKKEVKPLINNNPMQTRLDKLVGQSSQDNRKVFGRFIHFGRTWKVNSDTRYEPLFLAYKAAIKGDKPFARKNTRGGTPMLVLKSKIKRLQSTRSKYLYIYASSK